MAIMRSAAIGVIVATLGIAAIPATSYPVAARATKTETRAEKLRKALNACRKDKSGSKRKRCEALARACYGCGFVPQHREEEERRLRESRDVAERGREERERTTTSPAPASAPTTAAPMTTAPAHALVTPEALTATIVIRANSFGGPYPGSAIPLEGAIVVERLNLEGEVLGSISTTERTIHVAPGLYKIGRTREVAVDAGQTVEVTVEGPPVA